MLKAKNSIIIYEKAYIYVYIQGVPEVMHHLSFIKSSNFFQT